MGHRTGSGGGNKKSKVTEKRLKMGPLKKPFEIFLHPEYLFTSSLGQLLPTFKKF